MSSEQTRAVGREQSVVAEGGSARLHGNMGVGRLLFTVLAFNAPLLAVAGTVPLVVAFGGGIGTPLIFVIVGAAMAIFSVGYMQMSKRIPRAGAFYTYVTAGLGRPLGLSASFVAILAYGLGLGGVLPFVGISLESLVASYSGPAIPWWVWSLIVAVAIAVFGYLRVDFSARVLAVVVVCEAAVVLIYNAVVGVRGGATGQLTFGSFDPTSLASSGVAIGIMITVLTFSGFEATAIFRDEVRDPTKTIPRVTYLFIAIVTVFYGFSSWFLIQGYGQDDAVAALGADPATAYLSSVQAYLGQSMFDIATILLVTSGFASLTAVHNILSRYLFALSSDGILPRALAKPHPRFGSPYRASLALSIIALAFILLIVVTSLDPIAVYSTFVGITGYAFVVLMFLAALGIAAYLIRTRPTDVNVWQRIVAPVVAVVAMGALAILATVQLDLLTGSSLLSVVAVIAVGASIVFGVVLALVFRAARPQTYLRIGTQE